MPRHLSPAVFTNICSSGSIYACNIPSPTVCPIPTHFSSLTFSTGQYLPWVCEASAAVDWAIISGC